MQERLYCEIIGRERGRRPPCFVFGHRRQDSDSEELVQEPRDKRAAVGPPIKRLKNVTGNLSKRPSINICIPNGHRWVLLLEGVKSVLTPVAI